MVRVIYNIVWGIARFIAITKLTPVVAYNYCRAPQAGQFRETA